MEIESRDVVVATAGGGMPAFLCRPKAQRPSPAVLILMEAFGLTGHIRSVAARVASEGYVTIVPDLYWRDLPDNKFGYDQVPEGTALMVKLDHGDVIADIRAALGYLKSLPHVVPSAVGVTGFCMGGGFAFLTACTLSDDIAAVAPFYGVVLDEWIEAVSKITVPVYLFFGGADPFIPVDRVREIEARFIQLGKPYQLKVYPGADHGFFCDERESYSEPAARDSWRELTQFFSEHLKRAA